MTEGIIGYETLCEADSYISTHYLSNDGEYVKWNVLSNGEKEVLLTDAFIFLESLLYFGKKAAMNQSKAFPRKRKGYGLSKEENVKAAQTEIAVSILTDKLSYRKALQNENVTAFTVGDLKEEYDFKKDSLKVPLKAKLLLEPFLMGGYHVG